MNIYFPASATLIDFHAITITHYALTAHRKRWRFPPRLMPITSCSSLLACFAVDVDGRLPQCRALADRSECKKLHSRYIIIIISPAQPRLIIINAFSLVYYYLDQKVWPEKQILIYYIAFCIKALFVHDTPSRRALIEGLAFGSLKFRHD